MNDDSSTLIPNHQLRTALKLIEQGRYAKKQLEIETLLNSILKERNANKDSIIQQLREKDEIRQAVNILNNKIIEDKDKQTEYFKLQVADLNRQIKRANRKAWVIGGLGAAAIIALIFK